MTLPAADIIATYTSSTDNIDITSDIKALDGVLTTSVSGQPIQIEQVIETVSTSTTLSEGIRYIQDTSGITSTLPASPTTGRFVYVFNASDDENTIDGNGNNIMGESSVEIDENESFDLLYDGTEWKLV